jgi:hypothetical protein
MSLLSVVVGTDKNWNFSAVRSPIGLKLGGDLALVSQIDVRMVWFQDLFVFYIVNKQKNKKRQNCENRGFTKLVFSPPCRV